MNPQTADELIQLVRQHMQSGDTEIIVLQEDDNEYHDITEVGYDELTGKVIIQVTRS